MNKKKTTGLFLAGLFLVIAMSFICSGNAEAAGYKKIETDHSKPKTIRKVGKYYFKTLYGEDTDYKSRIYCSKKKDSGYRFMGIADNGCFTNGKYMLIFSANDKKLFRKSCATGKSKTLRRFTITEEYGMPDYWSIMTVVGNRVYIKWYRYPGMFKIYLYHLKDHSYKPANININVLAQKGRYFVGSTLDPNEDMSIPVSIYKSTSSGFSLVRTLTATGEGYAWRVGKRFYYVHYIKNPGEKGHKAVLYKCRIKGTGKKKIATFTGKGNWVMVTKCKSTYCLVSRNRGLYKYTFKTKKMKLVERDER